MPAAELEITPALASRLLADQQPDLVGLRLTELSRGWDNTMFRLGDTFAVRLPHRALAEQLLLAEQRWLPDIGQGLPLPVPIPVRIGTPTEYYPWHWSVLPWFDGLALGTDPDLDYPSAAEDLGRFLAALHQQAPATAPINDGRGCPLSDRDDITVERIEGLRGEGSPFSADDCDQLRQRWSGYLALPDWDGPPMWLHGDLHAMNVLQYNRRISAVIDFGDITSGDPATDLAIGYSLFTSEDAGERSSGNTLDQFRAAANSEVRPIDDATWQRAEGWAMSVGLAVIHSSADSPAMFSVGQQMLNLR